MILSHWYENGRVPHVVALCVRKSFDLWFLTKKTLIIAQAFTT